MIETIVSCFSDTCIPAPSLSTGSALLLDDPADLVRIREPGVNLVVYRRRVGTSVQKFVDEVLLPLDLKRIVPGTDAAQGPVQLLDGIVPMDKAQPFIEDLRELIERYTQVAGIQSVNLKLECFAGNLCERFHTDRVRLRLICSYAGPGTEWLADEEINRDWLGPRAGDRRDEESGLLREGATIRQLERFAVGIMKGDHWPGNLGKGLGPSLTARTRSQPAPGAFQDRHGLRLTTLPAAEQDLAPVRPIALKPQPKPRTMHDMDL